tara:strand:- start:65 stop:781 length:717 start_codon:yes stop_codon:yes gene_type:complete
VRDPFNISKIENAPFLIILVHMIVYFIYRYIINKKREADLEEYAEKNNFDFYKEPNEEQISLFKEFSSNKIINNKDKFFNLLVSQDNNDGRPLIAAGHSEFASNNGSDHRYTQVFLYKHNNEIPRFCIQKKNITDIFIGHINERRHSNIYELDIYKFKDKKFPHNKYYFLTKDTNIENFISSEFIKLLETGIKRKKSLINIESNGKNIIFYKQWSRHTTESMDYYLNLFNVLKESLLK